MNIGEFETASGLPRTTIRFYERRGLLCPAGTQASNGYRFYTPEQVERAKMIRLAQSLGFSLNEIIALMRLWEEGSLSDRQKRQVLVEKLGEIRTKMKNLKAMERYLTDKIAWMDNGQTGTQPMVMA
jgi:MerR family transcriptional regulator, copper efflux regulator